MKIKKLATIGALVACLYANSAKAYWGENQKLNLGVSVGTYINDESPFIGGELEWSLHPKYALSIGYFFRPSNQTQKNGEISLDETTLDGEVDTSRRVAVNKKVIPINIIYSIWNQKVGPIGYEFNAGAGVNLNLISKSTTLAITYRNKNENEGQDVLIPGLSLDADPTIDIGFRISYKNWLYGGFGTDFALHSFNKFKWRAALKGMFGVRL